MTYQFDLISFLYGCMEVLIELWVIVEAGLFKDLEAAFLVVVQLDETIHHLPPLLRCFNFDLRVLYTRRLIAPAIHRRNAGRWGPLADVFANLKTKCDLDDCKL